jgi:hypothetical protein
MRESRRAVELVPLEKDALNGLDMIHYSGIVAAWVGSPCKILPRRHNYPVSSVMVALNCCRGTIRSAAIPASKKSLPISHQRINRESSRLVICHLTSDLWSLPSSTCASHVTPVRLGL